MSGWQFDRDSKEHYLPFSCGDDEQRSMKVFKTSGGDYAVTCHYDSIGHGGEIEYAANLRKAKTFAETAIQSGNWYRLAP